VGLGALQLTFRSSKFQFWFNSIRVKLVSSACYISGHFDIPIALRGFSWNGATFLRLSSSLETNVGLDGLRFLRIGPKGSGALSAKPREYGDPTGTGDIGELIPGFVGSPRPGLCG
jgi:hypothetical protein